MNERREHAAKLMERVAAELELASKHAKVAAEHMQAGEAPRYGAHVLAAIGHIANANDGLSEAAKLHASNAEPTL